MRVIAELEATGREVYTGAIGFASPHAGLELNVAIRTFEARAGRLGSAPAAALSPIPTRGRARGMPRQSPPADRRDRRELERGAVPLGLPVRGIPAGARPRAMYGRLRRGACSRRCGRVRQRGACAPVARRASRRCPARHFRPIEVPDYDGAVRIEYRPGGEITITTRPICRARCRRADAVRAARRARRDKWLDRDLLDALPRRTTPLLFDADGTVLEAAWAAVWCGAAAALTPRRDGRILPSTSVPPALERDLTLEPGDELFLSSARAAACCRPCPQLCSRKPVTECSRSSLATVAKRSPRPPARPRR